ncbi:aminoglycoside phosphotransferase family protein [Actinoplanes sp. NPDC049265]|uniref:aminoglycoside phosphotransferase family protein n=1 Tax=Actinoplanes sp. NPDC049265 TaxID=3363902 RepID=UPI00371A7F02
MLQDSPHRRVERVGNTVRRPMHAWSESIHALLRHLESVGFPYSPRVLGVDAEGREVLTYLEGESGPEGWSAVVTEAGLVAMARLLRDYHDAVAGFRPPADTRWADATGTPHGDDVVSHGDFGPWNLVWRGTTPVGILDWDYAWPQPRRHDVAYALEYVAPFRPDDECLRWLRYPAPPDRRARIETFAAAYGLTGTDGLYDAVLEQQRAVAERALHLRDAGHQPQASWPAEFYDEGAGRIRWTAENRGLFQG